MENITIDAKQLNDLISVAVLSQSKQVLEGYKSPLEQIIIDAFRANDGAIRSQIHAAVENTVKSQNFAESLRAELNRKLANLVINKCSGLVEKSFNAIMADAVLRNKLQAEVIKIIEVNNGQ